MDKNERIKILSDLIKINSVNGNEKEVADYVANLFKTHGIDTEYIFEDDKTRANLIVEIGQKEDSRILGYSGHFDTVTLGDLTKWTHDPFGAEIDDGKIFGRGTADMKSGLAAIVIAMIELVESGNAPKGTLRFIGTVGEELGAAGSEHLNDLGYAKDLDALLIPEPTNGNIVFSHAGSLNYRVKSFGVSAHSSEPSRGINALTNLAQFIDVEKNLFDDAPIDHVLGTLSHSITIFKSGEQVNSIPDYAELWGNIRPTGAFNNDHVIEHLDKAVAQLNLQKDFNLELEIVHNFYPVDTPEDNSFVQLALQSSKDNVNSAAQTTFMRAATDASDFIKSNDQMPIIIYGSDEQAKAHQIDEYTTIDTYLGLIDSLKEIATKFFD